MKVAAILLTPIVGAVIGYRIGLWWLHRTVPAPELESAVYPVLGAIVGGVVGIVVALAVGVALWKPPDARR